MGRDLDVAEDRVHGVYLRLAHRRFKRHRLHVVVLEVHVLGEPARLRGRDVAHPPVAAQHLDGVFVLVVCGLAPEPYRVALPARVDGRRVPPAHQGEGGLEGHGPEPGEAPAQVRDGRRVPSLGNEAYIFKIREGRRNDVRES